MNNRLESKILKACVITGTRAEYGLLYWTLKELDQRPEFDLRLVVTGTHTSKHHGTTITEIEADGFKIDDIIEIQIDGDSRAATAKTTGVAMMGFADYFRRTNPDFVVVLGDRYESFAAASSSFLMGIPIVHLCGGDVSRGAFDDSLRHAISKFASLHCVSHGSHRKRLVQIGEESWRIRNVGNISGEGVLRLGLHERGYVNNLLGLEEQDRYVLVTYHPTTQPSVDSLDDVAIVNNIVETMISGTDKAVVVTGVNSDPGRHRIVEVFDSYSKRFPTRVKLYDSLGRKSYLSSMKYSDLVIGNSSSGLLEAPLLGIATIDVGDRQAGRCLSEGVYHSTGAKTDFQRTLNNVLAESNKVGKEDWREGKSKIDSHPSSEICEFILLTIEECSRNKNFIDLGIQ